MRQRSIDILVLSDIHLGTYGSHAAELCQYLESIDPEIIILNGDIVDIWQFNKSYFPPSHMKVLQILAQKLDEGTRIIYLTGNHDDLLRKFSDVKCGNLEIRDKLVLRVRGKSYWFFHGDVFDASINYAKWVARLGGKGYDFLIRLNRFINIVQEKRGKSAMSFSKRIKSNVKNAVKIISDFQKTAAQLAIQNNFDYVVCGHIHEPVIKKVQTPTGAVIYMNSGDWVESLTSLEYANDSWVLFDFRSMENQTPSQESKLVQYSETLISAP